ncbi:MAG: TolC family protein, partial [Duncaniella sp.]|nr:TolC family protein [Duncaniella sp.]
LTVCLIATFFPTIIIRAEEDTERYLRTPVPEQWIYTGIEMEAFPGDTEWWKSFADPTLDSLIHLGMERNLNVSQTMRRIEMARLSMSSAKSNYFPSIGVNAGYARTKSHNTEANVFSLGAKMNWEIDLFGKINSQVKAGKAALDLSRAEYRGAMLAMTAEIATYYINYRIYQTELEVARMHLESQGQVLKIAEARHEAGLVSKLDVAQARVVYGNTEVTIPQIEASIK